MKKQQQYDTMICMENIGGKIIELRQQKGISQAELARQLNFTASAVCRWEKNLRTPSDDDLVLIADFFGVTTEVLLGTEGVSESGTDNDLSAKEKRDHLDRNKQKKRVVFFSVGIILIVVCILTVLLVYKKNRFVLLEEIKTVGAYGEANLRRSYLIPERCNEDSMSRFAEKQSSVFETESKFDEFESFTFLFYESEQSYAQEETCLIHTVYRTDDVLE